MNRFARCSAVIALLLTLVAPPLHAQAGGRGGVQIGLQAPDLDPLNAALVAGGYPAFSDGLVTLGGFGFGTVGRILIGGEGHGFLPREETTTSGAVRSRLGGGYGLFNLGYMALRGRRIDLYPIFGIGGGTLQLDLIERSSPTFDEVLGNPGNSSRLAEESLLLSAAVGMDYRFGRGDREGRSPRRTGGLFLGVRAGWIWAPGGTRWELDHLNDVAGGPEVGPTGFYLRASFGGWGGR